MKSQKSSKFMPISESLGLKNNKVFSNPLAIFIELVIIPKKESFSNEVNLLKSF